MAHSTTDHHNAGNGRGSRGVQLLVAALACIAAMAGAMWLHGDIGILQQNMVAGKARTAAALPTDWPLASAGGKALTSLLFYSPDRTEFEARVYEKRTGLDGTYLKLGWFPAYNYAVSASDSESEEMQAVWCAPLTVRSERAYFSLNAAGAAEARTAGGTVYAILSADAPFALVGPEDLAFYDAAGHEVTCRMAPDSE